MKYYIIEIQTKADGSYSHNVRTAEDRAHAESVYYTVLAAASISTQPKHACILMTSEGFPLLHNCYTHGVEPAPEEEA